MKKIRISVQVEKVQLEALKRIQAKTGAAVAESIRRAIDSYIKKQSP